MNITYKSSFARDVKKVPKAILSDLDDLLLQLDNAATLTEIKNLKKLKGSQTAYRIRLHDYRVCFYYENDIITLARFLQRKDVYKVFP